MSDTPSAADVAKAISRMTNVGSKNELDLLAELLVNDHRTLQQGFMRHLVLPLLKLWAEDFKAGRYDDRNEGTVKFANDILTTLPEPFLPFI